MTTLLRSAGPTDAGRTGEILWDHAQAGGAGVADEDLFSCAEAIACCGRMIDLGWVTVALYDGRVEAFLARQAQEIHSLYVARDRNGQGLGKLLLQDAQAREHALRLQVRADNSGAVRFYRRLGFQPVEGGGGANDSFEMYWQRGTTP